MHAPQNPLGALIRALLVVAMLMFSVSAVTLAYAAGRHADAHAGSAPRVAGLTAVGPLR